MNNKESQLVIVEKYEEFINYIYPCIQNIARRHGIVKEEFLKIMFLQVELFYKAIKSDSKTRLYEADSNMATIRFYLRFFADKNYPPQPNYRELTQKQHQTASIKLAEVGKILGSIIKGK